jgi:hypothetical protein
LQRKITDAFPSAVGTPQDCKSFFPSVELLLLSTRKAIMTVSADSTANHSTSRKLSPEEAEQTTQRLYYQQQEKTKQWDDKRKQILAKVRPESKVITGEELSALVQRVYDQQVERKKKTKETLKMKQDAMIPEGKSITEGELQEMVQRMYYTENEKKVKTMSSLRHKYQPASPKKTLEKEQMEESAKRLSSVDWEKRERELYEKHVLPQEPKTAKLTKAQIQETATRLSTASK